MQSDYANIKCVFVANWGALLCEENEYAIGDFLMHNEFTAIIEKDGDWFIAYCPEIPGANG